MGAALEPFLHPRDALFERAPSREQRERVEIALQRKTRGQKLRGRARIDGGVEADSGEIR